MLLSFVTSLTYKSVANFTPDNCVNCEAAFVGHNQILARHRPMSGANIQAWNYVNRLVSGLHWKVTFTKTTLQL